MTDASATLLPTRRDIVIVASFAAASILVVLPYLRGGPGFFMDDWRNLARLDTVGWLRSAEASRFASRPGAWAVETVLYPLLRDHAVAWVFALAALNAGAATAIFVALRRFTAEATSLAIVLVWILLPNHTSMRTFANIAPMIVGLTLLAIGVILMDSGRLIWGSVAVALGGFCLEVMMLPGLVALIVLHHWRKRGTRKEALIGGSIIVIATALMLLHPTYSVAHATRGTPAALWPAHFGSGLTTVPAIAWALSLTAAVGILLGLYLFARGQRSTRDAPWLVVVGLAVMVVGLAPFILKWPTGYRGQADRTFVVSSVGSAIVWVGIGRLVWERSRALAVAGCIGFIAAMTATNITYQADWSRAAQETPAMLRSVACRSDSSPPSNLAVGPTVPSYGGVRALHQFFLDDATRVVLGGPMTFVLAEGEQEWRSRPSNLQLTWGELVKQRKDCGN
ncbi:MAG: hypothetical protein WCJ04_04540 [Actinomycetes bacterium]